MCGSRKLYESDRIAFSFCPKSGFFIIEKTLTEWEFNLSHKDDYYNANEAKSAILEASTLVYGVACPLSSVTVKLTDCTAVLATVALATSALSLLSSTVVKAPGVPDTLLNVTGLPFAVALIASRTTL